MRKFLAFAVLMAFAVLQLASCSLFAKVGGGAAAEVTQASQSSDAAAGTAVNPAPGTGTEASGQDTTGQDTTGQDTTGQDTTGQDTTGQDTSGQNAPGESTAVQNTVDQNAAPADVPIDTGLTLEAVKKAALDAGYKAEDIADLQLESDPKPLRGIFVNYADENLQSQSPVYEFKDAADALKFARQVNESGYSLSIVNGKLVTMTGSKYGVALYDKEKTTLETFLKSKVMAYEEPAPPQVSDSRDYAGDCTRIGAILKELDKLVNKAVIIYTKTLPDGDPNKYASSITFSMLSSSDMSFTSALSEDQAKMDEVVKTWEFYGATDVKLKHDAPNDYTLTGKRMGMDDPFSIRCVYSPDRDSLRIMDKNGSEVIELLEFAPLGGDKYAFQTLYERGIVGYKDGKITSLAYSANNRTKETAYKPDKDSIFPDGKGIGGDWVTKSGEDAYEQLITFDGTKLNISAIDFTGKKLKLGINVQ